MCSRAFSLLGARAGRPDFFGLRPRLRRTEDFPAAFKEAQGCGKPAIVRLAVDPEAITPALTLARIRAKSLAERGGSG